MLATSTPTADYRLRHFTPRSELPFAGHPTLGSAHALLEAGRIAVRRGGRVVQECNIGLVDVTIEDGCDGGELSFVSPPARIEPLSAVDTAALGLILGCAVDHKVPPARVDVGPIWVVVPLIDADAVLDLRPDFANLAHLEHRLGITGVTVFGPYSAGEFAIEVPTFAPSCGVDEDPVCGSGNAAVAALRRNRALLPPGDVSYVAAQGRRVGRDGHVKVHVGADDRVPVGGSCITSVDGILTLDQGTPPLR